MKSFSASTNIQAPADKIWSILTDGAGWPGWDPSCIRIEGRIAAGETVTAYTKLSPDRAFPVKVIEFVPGQKMTWASGMPLGLFKGERTFRLAPKGDGSVDFTLREEFTGLLLPIFGATIPDMTAAFQGFVAGLKARAES